jgi:TatD DNase family protein
MGLIDSHAHLDSEDYAGELDAVLARARAAGLERIVCIGLWRAPGSFGNAVELATREPGFFSATAGVHPHECARVPEEDWRRLEDLSCDPRVVAIGETGLDFHYDHSPRAVQEASFRRSIALARNCEKPLVIHVREADDACLRILHEEGVPAAGGVIHCFTGDAKAARAYLDLGLFISASGVVTFKTADAIREAIRLVPRDRLLVETDSPYLAPVPHRGRRNEPAFVAETARKVAELWGATEAEVAAATTANVKRLFRIP